MKQKKYEYQTRYYTAKDMPPQRIESYLNEKGQEGWELVHVITIPMIDSPGLIANYTFFWKRPA